MSERLHQGRELFELGAWLGRLGTVAIGSGGGSLASALARAAGCGVALAGAEARFHDGSCAACGVWLAGYYGFPAALFLRQEGEDVRVYIQDGTGRPITGNGLLSGGGGPAGEWDLLAGADCAWAARRVSEGPRQRGAACAQGPFGLTVALNRLGYEVSDHPVPGAPLFLSDEEGFDLTVKWNGRVFRPGGLDALEAVVSFLAEPKAIPAFGPAAPPSKG